jgi:hypothetical protein
MYGECSVVVFGHLSACRADIWFQTIEHQLVEEQSPLISSATKEVLFNHIVYVAFH